MSDLKYSEILRQNRSLASITKGPLCRIGILSNVVVNPLGEILEYYLRSIGINATVAFGNYDNIVQDAERFSGCDVVILFWEIAEAFDALDTSARILPKADFDEIRRRFEVEIDLTLSALSNTSLVLFNAFTALPFMFSQLRSSPLDKLAKTLNHFANTRLVNNSLMISVEHVIAATGLDASIDWRQYHLARAPYSIEFLKNYANHIAPAIASLMGKARKVLVLDCDNTLWGGILGEDGTADIKIGDSSSAGRAFRDAQLIIKGMQSEGILLALCSKNNPEDVETIFRDHPDMILRNEDFVARRINWSDKAKNLREISLELNLGLDSFVFVDDSDFEIGLIRKELPMVHCVKVPSTLTEYPAAMRKLTALFFSLSRSAEDERKTQMYREEAMRREAEAASSSVEDYLRSLQLKIVIKAGEAVPIQRAAQLTQKTNQFNLTTRRYTETDIARFSRSSEYQVLAFSVADRFGDYGMTGLAIIKLDQAARHARIDTFLMSCRVLGRNVEFAFFEFILGMLRKRGIRSLEAEYIPSQKNIQVASLYEKLGFDLTKGSDVGDVKHYLLDVGTATETRGNYIEVEGTC